jgi:aminoglycoside phosphotransferase (APT) family kinase protein
VTPRLHANDQIVDLATVRRLISTQEPDLASLALRPFASGGTDNCLWQIGEHAIGRFPRLPKAAEGIAREIAWLNQLPTLPLQVPRLLFAGQPDDSYPFPWAVLGLLPGADAATQPPASCAETLATTIAALQSAPVPPDLPPVQTGRLSPASIAFARDMAAAFTPDEGDVTVLTHLLDHAESLPPYTGRPVWTHGDLHALNLLTQDGTLTAVIDWGSLGAGDPARDLICAWTMLDADGRRTFRTALAPDPAAWTRARAFALVMAVQAIPYYRDANPRFRDAMRLTLSRVLDDPG